MSCECFRGNFDDYKLFNAEKVKNIYKLQN